MKKALLVMLVLAPLVVGCASTKQVTVRTHLPPLGTVGVAPTTTVVVPQQYRSAPVVEEDPLVLQARAIGRQMAIEKERWDAACLELRREAMRGGVYADYNACSAVLGNKPSIDNSYGYGYGRSVGGSVIGNSGGRVRWR